MANFNRVLLIGNLTRDPQLRYTPNQAAVCDFGIAVNRQWTGADGQKREETCFVDCTAWGRQAEILSKYMSKGRPLFVEGRLTFRQWEGKDGKRRSKIEVTVENFQFLGGRGGDRGGGGGGPGSSQDTRRQQAAGEEDQAAGADYDFNEDVEDDTIPF